MELHLGQVVRLSSWQYNFERIGQATKYCIHMHFQSQSLEDKIFFLWKTSYKIVFRASVHIPGRHSGARFTKYYHGKVNSPKKKTFTHSHLQKIS